MSARLQVLLAEEELREIRTLAKRDGVNVGEWVRRALRAARQDRSAKDPAEKLAAMQALLKMNLPTGDIEQMLEETERGYPRDLP
jgi:hypothetical protein